MGGDMHDENACANDVDGVPKATIWTSPDAMSAWNTYAKLHTRLFPYLYANALEANRSGAPQQRSLFFEFPDPSLAHIDDEFFLGDAILVAPVVHRGERTRNVIFPPGKYLEWPDMVVFQGSAMVDAPLDKLPMFLRADHLVPLYDASIDTLDDRPHPGVIGPSDVAAVYDVIGLVVSDAKFADNLEAKIVGTPPSGRVQVEASGDVTMGGLLLHNATGRRVRWDLYVAP
jgi:alpha-glucosidase (family GH31 glycosyl hydrolase)